MKLEKKNTMSCSSYSRIFFVAFLMTFLYYSFLDNKAEEVASNIPDMESSDESHRVKREITARIEKQKLEKKVKTQTTVGERQQFGKRDKRKESKR